MVLAKRLLTFLPALALAGCVLNADAPLSPTAQSAMELVPADARVVAFADAASLMETAEAIVGMEEDNEAGVREFWEARMADFAELGLDPREDIEFVTVYATASDEPVVTAVGRFDHDAIASFVASKAPVEARESADGFSIWTMDNGGTLAVAENGTRVVAGESRADVLAALDTRGGANLAAIGRDALSRDAWFVVRDLSLVMRTESEMRGEVGMLAQALESLAVGGSVTTEEAAGIAVLHPREGVTAKDLASLVRGLVSAARLQSDLPEEVRDRLDEVRVAEEDGAVVVSGSMTRDFLETLARR